MLFREHGFAFSNDNYPWVTVHLNASGAQPDTPGD
jgi:hypothetical protein